ncbi:MAG: PrsW family glutamic-type intramembrane protease [Acidimicrobiales bacterium]
MQPLTITVYGQTRAFSPGSAVSIGRDPRSTVVLGDPTVAGCHIVVQSEHGTWVARSQSPGTYVNGQPVSVVVLDRPVTLRLGGPNGPDVALGVVAGPTDVRPPTTAGQPQVPGPGLATQTPVAFLGAQLSAFWKSAPSLSVLLPIRSWWESREWRKGYPLFFLVFALAPYVIFAAVSPAEGIKTVAWAYVGVFSVLWALLFFTLIRPGKVDAALFAEIAVTSAVFGIPLAIWMERRLPGHDNLLHYILAVGLPEELAKAAPIFVIMVLLSKGRSYSTRMFMYMGAISGLAFGTVEGVGYIRMYERLLLAGNMSPAAFVQILTMRFLTDSLFHACTAIITAYFIGLAVKNPMWRVQLMAFGIGMMAVLHGINDRWASGWPLVGIAATLLFVVIGYVQNGDRIEAEVSNAAARDAAPRDAGSVAAPVQPSVPTASYPTNGLVVPATGSVQGAGGLVVPGYRRAG